VTGLQPHEAKDEILALFKTHWDANVGAVGVTVNSIVYDNDDELDAPPVPYWVRVSVVLTPGGGQRTMSEPGRRTFERTGTVFVNVFAPKGEGVTTAQRLAKIALDAFEGKHTAGNVWFVNGRVESGGQARNAYQENAVVDFTFDEIK
jgi:hypothetical protein